MADETTKQTYGEALASAWEAREKAIKPYLEIYEKAESIIWELYEKAITPARRAYERRVKAINLAHGKPSYTINKKGGKQ